MLERSTLSAIVSVLCLVAWQAEAQPGANPFVDLQYQIDPSLRNCPTMSEFSAIIARELGYDPYLAGSPIGLAVKVQPSESGLEAIVKFSVDAEKQTGERRFVARAEECHAMLKTVGFVASVQIQLMAEEHGAKKDDEPPNDGPAREVEPRSKLGIAPGPRSQQTNVTLSRENFETARPPTRKRAEWTVLVGAGTAVGVGFGPSAVAFGRFFGAVQRRSLELELGVEASLPSTTRQSDGVGFREQSVLGTVAGCFSDRPISACALTKLGVIGTEGVGVDLKRAPKGLLVEVGSRVAYGIELSERWILRAHVDALVSVNSWSVEVNDTAVWRMPRFAGLAGIDVATQFR